MQGFSALTIHSTDTLDYGELNNAVNVPNKPVNNEAEDLISHVV